MADNPLVLNPPSIGLILHPDIPVLGIRQRFENGIVLRFTAGEFPVGSLQQTDFLVKRLLGRMNKQ